MPADWNGTVLTSVISSIVLLSSCSSPVDPIGVPEGPAARGAVALMVNPVSASLVQGDRIALEAAPVDRQGRPLPARPTQWSTSNSSVARVSTSGEIDAVSPGTATITAASDGRSAMAEVTVTSEVASIHISPSTAIIPVAGSMQLTAQARDSLGEPLVGYHVTWSSSNTGVATVDAQGVLRGIATGLATVTAEAGGKSGSLAVTVRIPPVASVTLNYSSIALLRGETARLTAILKDDLNNTLTNRQVTWASSDPGVVSVDFQGTVTALELGTATITATSEGKSATTAVAVVPPVSVNSVVITPGSADLYIGDERQFSATVRDNQNRILAGKAVGWQSSNPGIASVTQEGLVRAIAPGSVTITATSEGRSGTAAVVVRSRTVHTIVVTPNSLSLGVGSSSTLTVRLYDDKGTLLTGRPVSWHSGSPSVASVSNGTVTGNSVGNTNITVSSDGKQAVVPVTVVASGSGSWNEPAGFVRRVERPFANVDEGWFYSTNGRFTIVSTPSGPRSPGSTGQIRFDDTFGTGGSPAKTSVSFTAAPQQLYMLFWFQISSNYVGSPHGVGKVVYAANRLGAGCNKKSSFFNALTGDGSAGFPLTSFTQDTEIQSGRRLNPNLTNVLIQRGRWYRIEVLVVANTPGVRNGQIHTWIDGVKTTEYRDIGWVQYNSGCPRAGEWLAVEWNPTWGRRDNPDDHAVLVQHGPFFQWMDHFYVSGR